MPTLREWFGPSREEIWRQFSQQVGAEYIDPPGWKRDYIQATHRGWTITLDIYIVSTGKTAIPFTRFRAPFVNPDGFRFSIGRKNLLHVIGILMGAQDAQVGHRDFDDAFVIKTNNDAKLRDLFSSQALRERFQNEPTARLTIKDDEGLFGPNFPEGVDELQLMAHGHTKDVARLKSFYDLFAMTLDELCRIGSAYENTPPVKLT